MESIEDQSTHPAVVPALRRDMPSLQLAAAVSLLAALLAVLLTLGSNWGAPPATAYSNLPTFRYVNSGWVSPHDVQGVGPFTKELRAYVIVNQEELDAFQTGFVSKAVRGNPTSLGRIDFDTSVLLAAYYLWRPVKGDPLTVTDVTVDGDRTVVQMELDSDAQGREYAYLYAPMTMVAVERALFPSDEPVEFVFELDGHDSILLTAVPN